MALCVGIFAAASASEICAGRLPPRSSPLAPTGRLGATFASKCFAAVAAAATVAAVFTYSAPIHRPDRTISKFQ